MIGWVKTLVAGIAYCDVGGHFVANGARVWRHYATPLKSTRCVCERCAGELGTEPVR